MSRHRSHHHHETTTSEDAIERDRVETDNASADDASHESAYESVFENPEQLGTAEYVDLELARINPPV